MSKYIVEVKQDLWSKLRIRQQIWLFLQNNISEPWTRHGNIFEFSDSKDAVIFRLFWK